MDIVNIARGILNATKNEFGVGDPEVERKAEERIKVCLTCSTLSDDRKRCDGNKGGCNCFVGWKSRSNSPCPLNKW